MNVSEWGLPELLAPVSFRQFEEEYRERTILHVTERAKDYYANLFSRSDLDLLLWVSKPGWGKVQLANSLRGADWVDYTALPPDAATLRQAYCQGDTVVINDLQELWPPVAALSRACEERFGCLVNVNAYLTPDGSQGLGAHYDTQDGLILQIEGAKLWKLYGSARELPLPDDDTDISDTLNNSVAREIRLNPGDLLYIPRGFVHEAITLAESSLHLTVTVNDVRWGTLVEASLGSALRAASAEEIEFRRSLPKEWLSGCATTELNGKLKAFVERLAARVSAEEGLEIIASNLFREMRPLPGQLFDDDSGRRRLEPATVVEKARGMLCRLTKVGDRVRLAFPGGSLEFPRAVESALRVAARCERFAVGDLGESLSDSSKVMVVQRLIDEGIVVISQHG